MAAGKGTRIRKSSVPKVFYRLSGKALRVNVVECAAQLSVGQVVAVTRLAAIEIEAWCARITGAKSQFDS